MAVSIRTVGSEVFGFATGNINVPKPAGAAVGDAWYVAVFSYTADPTPPTTSGTQWTKVFTTAQSSNRVVLYRKLIDGTEGTNATFVSGGTTISLLPFLATGVDQTQPEDVTVVSSTVFSGTSIQFPSAFARTAGSLDVALYIGEMNSGITSSSPGYTVMTDSSRVHALTKSLSTYGANAPLVTTNTATVATVIAIHLVIRAAGGVQYVLGPTTMPTATTVYSGGPHVLNSTSALVPERRLPAYARPHTTALRGVNGLSRCKHPQTISDGTYLDYQSRNYHKVLIDCYDLLVVVGNYQGTDGALTGLGDVTYRASLVRPQNADPSLWASNSGVEFYPVWFPSGRDVTLKPGAIAIGTVSVDLPAGTSLFSQVRATTSSGNIPLHTFPNPSVYEGTIVSAGSDLTSTTSIPLGYGQVANNGAGGSAPSTTGNYTVRPVAIYAVPKGIGYVPHIVIAGDSIGDGAGRAGTFGYIEQALELAGTPYINLSQSGELARDFGNRNGHQLRGRIAGLPTAVAHEYGRNDVSSGDSLALVQSYLVRSWRMWQDRGAPVHQPTITPYSTSTDGWVTATNQTTHSSNTVRVNLNAWIRDGAPINGSYVALATGAAAGSNVYRAGAPFHPLASWWEAADLVESARDSGKWLPSAMTADGLHPGDSGHNMLAAGVPTARFTAQP